jgi:hypothetical protein
MLVFFIVTGEKYKGRCRQEAWYNNNPRVSSKIIMGAGTRTEGHTDM